MQPLPSSYFSLAFWVWTPYLDFTFDDWYWSAVKNIKPIPEAEMKYSVITVNLVIASQIYTIFFNLLSDTAGSNLQNVHYTKLN